MPSKLVVDRQKAAEIFEAAAKAHAGAADAGLREWLGPDLLAGEPPPDTALLFRALERAVARRRAALVEADAAVDRARRSVRASRRGRDQAMAGIRKALVALRRLADSAFGDDDAYTLLGLEGRIAEDPARLLRQADAALAGLRALPAEPRPTYPSVRLDEELTEFVAGAIAALRAALAEVDRSRAETAAPLAAKAKAQTDFDDTLRRATRLIEAHLLAAGHDAAALRMRPRARRKRRSGGRGRVPAG